MKKLVIITLFLFIILSCSDNEKFESIDKEIETLKAKIVELEQKIDDKKETKTNTKTNFKQESITQCIILQGGVIVGQDDFYVKYHKKCDACGELYDNISSMSIPSYEGEKNHDRFTCSKCGHRQKVIVKAIN